MNIVAVRLSNLAIGCVSRCPETGSFRFVFHVAGREVVADLTVCWLEDRGLAWFRFASVDRVRGTDRAIECAVEGWVAAHESEVWSAAMGCP